MIDIQGGCLCGQVRYSFAAEPAPLAATYCHCSMCRKATGSPYATFVSVSKAALQWTKGSPHRFRSSPIATRGFCASCGTPLFYDPDAEPEVAVTVGSLDDAASVKPDHHYGIESRLTWVTCGKDLPERETEERFEGQP